jgi:TM2 domain-containing membrane protein YozV
MNGVQQFVAGMIFLITLPITIIVIYSIYHTLKDFKIWRQRNDVTYENLTRQSKGAIVSTHSSGPK